MNQLDGSFCLTLNLNKMSVKYTNRGFLDLENYGYRSVVEILVIKLRNNPEFIDRIGDKLYFQFDSQISQLNFFKHIRETLANQGYATAIVEEIDYYEIEQRMKDKMKIERQSMFKKSKPLQRLRTEKRYEKVPINNNTRSTN